MLYNHIQNQVKEGKMIALLIDPDKHDEESLHNVVVIAEKAGIDFFLVGGSITIQSINITIQWVKKFSTLPVFLFPGNILQLSDLADGIFLISLISGRNPDFLIGQQVLAAPFLKSSGMEIIPVGYILLETGATTSVEYMSNTRPIPLDKHDIAVATAMAGEMLGHKLIYLEGGSGACNPVSLELISEVKKKVSIPIVAGGGIRSARQAREIFNAGADLIVIGTIAEENPASLFEIVEAKKTSMMANN
jgi:putative glycerol-1-phosphate prenyltransferase